jgi:hypothetical protein
MSISHPTRPQIPHSVHHPIHLRRPTRLIYAYPNTPSTAPSTPHPTPQRTKHPPIGLQSHLSATLINRPREVRMCPGYNVSRVKVTHIPATDADRTFIIISFQFPGPRWIYPCMSQVCEVLFAPMRISNQGSMAHVVSVGSAYEADYGGRRGV